MNVVFLNSLQKKTGEDRVITAKVLIGEENGVWKVVWSEPEGGGETPWFEGDSWNEMLKAFRGFILEKMGEGYAPLLNGVADDLHTISGRAELIQKLYYYGDVHKREEIYEELRTWRRKRATEEGKVPYMIATNRLLALLSAFLPRTREELLQLPGFGEWKADQYGKEILAVTAKADREHEFPLDWVADRIDDAQYKLWLHHQQRASEERKKRRREQRTAVLEGARNGAGLQELEKANVPRRDAVALLEELDREGYDVDPVIQRELSTVPEDERRKALAAFGELGDRYLKPIVRALYGEEGLKGERAERAYEWLRLLRIRYRRMKEAQAAEKAG